MKKIIFFLSATLFFSCAASAQNIIIKNVEIEKVKTRWLGDHARFEIFTRKPITQYSTFIENADSTQGAPYTLKCQSTLKKNQVAYWTKGRDIAMSQYLSQVLTAASLSNKFTIDLIILDSRCDYHSGAWLEGIVTNIK